MKYRTLIIFFFLFIFRYSYFSLDQYSLFIIIISANFCLFLLQFFSTSFSFSFSISLILSTIFTIPATHTVAPVSRNTSLNGYFFDTHTRTPRNLYTARVHFILRAATRNSLRIARRLSTSHFQFIFLHHYLSLRPCVFILWHWQIVLLHLSLHCVYSV